ncbi:hypothetical protein CVT25_004102 [Psilocybe cyanescens]|uniref:DNA 3'-5' helicase n=1 Tax=Psilocybe cyanescens TaxID=93625 RepID=A0A409X910_PSICY|nr:hypothetical protein CVT25_004102 [Psilocybe cyanescens]
MPPPESRVKKHKASEVNLSVLAEKALEVLGKRPFQWQLDAARAILCGHDLILDVGTGCGKSLCFSLPLLLSETDISITVSPLSALMIDQASSSRIPTVAVCQETVTHVGKAQMYSDIVNGKFRHVIVSPEIHDDAPLTWLVTRVSKRVDGV